MTRRTPLPPPLDATAFTTGRARASGVGRGRLRATDLAHPFHAVHAPTQLMRGATDDERLWQTVACYAARMGPGQFFSHTTAARMLHLPLPARCTAGDELHVSVLAPAFPPQCRGVVGHRLNGARLGTVRGYPVCDPVSAWCQSATLLSIGELVAVGDFLLSGAEAYGRGQPPATAEDLLLAVRMAGHRPGVAKLRAAVRLVRTNVLSPKETELRLLIVGAGLPEPVTNHPVRCADGVIWMLDLAYPQLRLGLEYEGDIHRSSRAQFLKDIERREIFRDIDWDIIRVASSHLSPAGRGPLCARIARRIAARRRELG